MGQAHRRYRIDRKFKALLSKRRFNIQREGGKITLEDMNRYHAVWEEPLRTSYREYTVFTPTPWGGINMIQALHLLGQDGPFYRWRFHS
jgi:gamma-glutamyltranspeptidase